MSTRVVETKQRCSNERVWAIGREYQHGKSITFHARRIVWGRLMARAEKREGEVIRRAMLLVTGK